MGTEKELTEEENQSIDEVIFLFLIVKILFFSRYQNNC